MDANGTKLHLLLGRDDWGRCREEVEDGTPAARTLGELWPPDGFSPDAAAAWDRARAELKLRPELFRFDPAAATALDQSARRGAAIDRFGNWYWISDDRGAILVTSSGSGTTSELWRPGMGSAARPARRPGEFERIEAPPVAPLGDGVTLSGLAVTEDHHLAVGLLEPKGMLVFDLLGGGPPMRWDWPPDVPFAPFDIAARRRGGVFVLDATARRLWELDRHFLVVAIGTAEPRPATAGAFGPVTPRSGGARPTAVSPVSLADAAALEGEPISVEAARDGTVLVLDRNPLSAHSLLRRYRGGAVVGRAVALTDGGLDVCAYDMALVSADLGDVAAPLGRLYVVAASGNQAYAFALGVPDDQLAAAGVQAFFPLRSFGGRALAVDATRAYYDFADRFVALTEQPRPRFVTEATLLSPPFDGGVPDCVWHRLMLDGCVPAESAVEVWSRTANDAAGLALAGWQAEPAPLWRSEGSELPFVDAPGGGRGTWELLFQRAKGRHMQLRLRLSGDGRTSPRLRALRAYYPRFSYLDRYLPKVYREDAESASFLDRFLANPEGINTAIEDRIAAAQILLDPDATPLASLDWLAGWFELALAADWDEHKRRLFVRNAARFLALRGTIRGLELALRLALEPCIDEAAFDEVRTGRGGPRIIERFRTRTTPPAVLGDPTAPAGPRVVATAQRWRPTDGGDALDERLRAFVQAARGDAAPDPSIHFSAVAPEGALAELWASFAAAELGFVPASGVDGAWRDFLRSRYGRIAELRGAWGVTSSAPSDFASIALPTDLPADGTALRDWYEFQAVALPMRARAHAFTVLLPVPVDETAQADHDARRALAERVVSLQKPAHTVFDVKFYWSAFRVGEARLGLDTLIDLGSRSAALLPPLVLGGGYVGESQLGGTPAPGITRPPSAGRQPLPRSTPTCEETP